MVRRLFLSTLLIASLFPAWPAAAHSFAGQPLCGGNGDCDCDHGKDKDKEKDKSKQPTPKPGDGKKEPKKPSA